MVQSLLDFTPLSLAPITRLEYSGITTHNAPVHVELDRVKYYIHDALKFILHVLVGLICIAFCLSVPFCVMFTNIIVH